MQKEKFLPILLGSDENVYGTARLFYEEYGIKPLALCTRALMPTMNSNILRIKTIEGFDSDKVFPEALYGVLSENKDKYEKLIVVSCSDYYSEMLAKHYDSFDGMIANKYPSYELLSELFEKDGFYSMCEKHGLPYPKTAVVECDERVSVLDRLGFDFPIIVKPDNSNGYDYLHCKFEGKKKVFCFNDKESYLKMINSMNQSDYKGRLVIQEYIEGNDSTLRVINSYSDSNGKVRAMCVGRPILQEYHPATIGNYAAIIPSNDEKIYQTVKNFLEGIGYVGFSNIDLKYNYKTGEFAAFELNPRLGRSSFYVYGTGLNMMKQMIDDVVYRAESSLTIGEGEKLWLNVPRSAVGKYVTDREMRNKAKKLIRSGKCFTTLEYKGDFNIKRFLRIKRYFYCQKKNFKLYFQKKGNSLF